MGAAKYLANQIWQKQDEVYVKGIKADFLIIVSPEFKMELRMDDDLYNFTSRYSCDNECKFMNYDVVVNPDQKKDFILTVIV